MMLLLLGLTLPCELHLAWLDRTLLFLFFWFFVFIGYCVLLIVPWGCIYS
jgi:hypothetical protein